MELPVWVTAQICIVLYVVGVSLPYAFDYISHKEYKQIVRGAIERYETQKRELLRKCREHEQIKARRALVASNAVKNRPVSKVTFNRTILAAATTNSSDSSSSSSSSSSSTEEEEEEEEEDVTPEIVLKNDRATLMQYVNGMDLFDGQSCTTSASAATTIMISAPRRKPGSVHHL